jgi:hypothetical protein
MQMPSSIQLHVEQIRAYATMAAAEAHGSQAKELVTLLHRSADELVPRVTDFVVLARPTCGCVRTQQTVDEPSSVKDTSH